jgi:5,10-methylenetetrahydromethanopterin reductase
MVFGTVLEPGEDHTSPHVRDAMGPTVVTMYHGALARGRGTVDALPGGREWRLRVEAELPEGQRHLVHRGHLVAVSERDRSLLDSAGPFLATMSWVGTAETIRARIDTAAARGATGIMYAPAGSDIPRELRTFARAAGL